MYQVLDNGRPAEYPRARNLIWGNSKFEHFLQAVDYARNWCGHWNINLPEQMVEAVKYDYNGYGDTIEIIVLG